MTAQQTNGAPVPRIPSPTSHYASNNSPCSAAPYAGLKIAKYSNSVTEYVEVHKGQQIDRIEERIANKPIAVWLGGWSGNVKAKAKKIRREAQRQKAMYTVVAYNIPHRDCHHYSGNGDMDKKRYLAWVQELSDGLKGGKGIVVLEPDAIALTDCLTKKMVEDRYDMLRNAVKKLKAAGAKVYIDAGHANWLDRDAVGEKLEKAGVQYADGFALNTANAVLTERSVKYGNYIARRLKSKKGFIVDVSRNGAGAGGGKYSWCNSKKYRLGEDPTFNTKRYGCFLHGLLWVKVPGESDGECNGNPPAGQFSADLAESLVG